MSDRKLQHLEGSPLTEKLFADRFAGVPKPQPVQPTCWICSEALPRELPVVQSPYVGSMKTGSSQAHVECYVRKYLPHVFTPIDKEQ